MICANPASPNFNSLSDFYYNKGKLEIRIPWQLLNVMDPSGKYVIDDMYIQGKISSLKEFYNLSYYSLFTWSYVINGQYIIRANIFCKYTSLKDILILTLFGVLENLGYKQLTILYRIEGIFKLKNCVIPGHDRKKAICFK